MSSTTPVMHTNQGMMMEGLPLETTNWSSGTEDELVRELLDDESPFFLPLQKTTESKPSPANVQLINQLISTVYSGPTIYDIENSLPTASRKEQSAETISQTRMPMLDRGLMGKIENNKYTLKLKFCDNGMADDGYKWRKYGQKSIKNSPYPRSYYRCTNPRCSAKKQVERSGKDQDTLIITYEGLHLHFAYPHFMLDNSDMPVNPPLPVKKKPKVVLETESSNDQETQQSWEEAQDLYGSTALGPGPLPCCMQDELGLEAVGPRPQGLLEDVVPFLIRNPSSSNNVSSNSSSCSSYRSPPTSPSSLSWSPKH